MMLFYVQFSIAILIDLLVGDPVNYPHPVKIIGKVVSFAEKTTRPMSSSQVKNGALTVGFVISLVTSVLFFILYFARTVSPTFEAIVAIGILYTSLAMRDLIVHSNDVMNSLIQGDHIEIVREKIGKIVGRDTSSLDQQAICRACIETISENMVDGILSPIFFGILAAILSPIESISPISYAALGAMAYKSINTMDSMIGYKNAQYKDFGRCAARLDDIVNFIPARLSGIFLIVSSFMLRYDTQGAYLTLIRDRLNHSSPNGGHPEAATAGALGVKLGGPSVYSGQIIHKPFIGKNSKECTSHDIRKTQKLVLMGTFLFILFCYSLYFLAY